jgi:hypothetical protein
MQAEHIVEHLTPQVGKEVVLRVAGREYAIRSIYDTSAAVIIEAGELITADAAVTPQEALREADQMTPVADVVPDAVLDEDDGVQSPAPGDTRKK